MASESFGNVPINRIWTCRTNLEKVIIQFDFRKGKSTQGAINKYCDSIKRADDKYLMAIFDKKGDFDHL